MKNYKIKTNKTLLNKKAMSVMGILISAIVLFAIGAILLGRVIPFIKNSIDQQTLSQCMKTFDYDNDGFFADDTCPCNPGKVESQEAMYLDSEPTCILVPTYKNEADGTKTTLFVYGEVDKVYCDKKVDDIVKKSILDNCKGLDIKKSLSYGVNNQGNGLTKECSIAIAQKKPRSEEPLNVCLTPVTACTERFKENPECKK